MYSRTNTLPPAGELNVSLLICVCVCVCVCVSVCSFVFCVALRALDILSDEVLLELSAAYRRMVSHVHP